MHNKRNIFSLTLLLALPLVSCSAGSQTDTGLGSAPTIPKADSSFIPTINVASAKGWPEGATPIATYGFSVRAFAKGMEHPRWIYILPNGDVLVAETNAPPKPDDAKGITGFFTSIIMKKAGAETKSPNRILLLRDTDGDGIADSKTVFIEGLNSPFGMAVVGNSFYVADTDAVLQFPYHSGDTSIDTKGVKVTDLPAGSINHHWTKNILASRDGKYLYVTVGSNSNAADNGIEVEEGRAAIWQINRITGKKRIFASGLRNPNGLAWQPKSNQLWTTVNERDELGNNLVPDYMTSVMDGGFYGWPYSYWGQHVDERVKPQRPDLVAKALVPDYGLGNHTASLGLVFYESSLFPTHYRNGAFIGQHGSWNREPLTGYKVVFVPFSEGSPNGMPEDFLTGFLDQDNNALGRPVGVAIDHQGALLVADDVGNVIWRVSPLHP